MEGKSEAARVSAAVALLDRGSRKPKQEVEVQGDADKPLQTISRIECVIVRPGT